jgi:hypothetical protein
MKAHLTAARLAIAACLFSALAPSSHADYIVNGGELQGTYRIHDDGSLVGYYVPPQEAQGLVETWGEDAAVTPDLTTVYQFTNSLGMSTAIFAYDVESRNYLPDKMLHSGFFGQIGDDFIANAAISLIRPNDPMGKGDLFSMSGSFPFMSGLTPQIKRYNRATDSYVETIDPPTPQPILDFGFGPDDRLYMAAQTGIYVYEEDAAGFDLVSSSPLLGNLTGKLTFGPDGLMYLINPDDGDIERYTTAGSFVDTIVPSVGVGSKSIQFGVDGNIHVLADYRTIRKYDGTTGSLLGTTDFGGSDPFFENSAYGRVTYLPAPEPNSCLLAVIGMALVFVGPRRA